MKIKKANGKTEVRISRKEWEAIGKKAGWDEDRISRGRCPACEVSMINGVRCHEHGCPEAWRDSIKTCRECGCDFKPENSEQCLCTGCMADEYR